MWSIFNLMWDSLFFSVRFQFSFPEYYIFIQTNEMLFIICLSFRCDIKFKSRVGIDYDRFTNVLVCTSWARAFLSLCSWCNFNNAVHQFSLLRWYSSPARRSWISIPQTSWVVLTFCWHISWPKLFICSFMWLYCHWHETSAARNRYFVSCTFLKSIL